ncbi:hypothetical protein [Haloparvum sedimenti]|uniref:hypothetical protein n=1 Tax=Haloparvum sedimenti TaxID=1678448 RepID=UPI00071E69C3|nr:hypothetical protein [Haloparvum sedimenti]
MQRRRVLLGASALLGGLAGCSASDGNPSRDDETPTTDGNGSADDDGPAVEVRATVVDQPAETGPAAADLEVKNVSRNTITVQPGGHGGEPLEWVGESLPGAAGEAVFHPVGTRGVTVIDGSFPSERNGGCWRADAAADGGPERALVSAPLNAELAPEEAHTVRQRIYYRGPPDTCFSASEYRTSVSVDVYRDGSRTEAPDPQETERTRRTYDLVFNTGDEFTVTMNPEEDDR